MTELNILSSLASVMYTTSIPTRDGPTNVNLSVIPLSVIFLSLLSVLFTTPIGTMFDKYISEDAYEKQEEKQKERQTMDIVYTQPNLGQHGTYFMYEKHDATGNKLHLFFPGRMYAPHTAVGYAGYLLKNRGAKFDLCWR